VKRSIPTDVQVDLAAGGAVEASFRQGLESALVPEDVKTLETSGGKVMPRRLDNLQKSTAAGVRTPQKAPSRSPEVADLYRDVHAKGVRTFLG